jgi:hypothetical protein
MGIILTTGSVYQVTARIADHSIDNYAIISYTDTIYPYFITPVENDPDVRGLTVFLQDSDGQLVSEKIWYSLDGGSRTPTEAEEIATDSTKTDTPARAENWLIQRSSQTDSSNAGATMIRVAGLSAEFPSFSIPETIPVGHYSMVFLVQGTQNTLFKIEKPVYFLGNTTFAVGSIHSYLPDFSDIPNLVPPETVVMLETPVSHDSELNPYIVWYNDKNKIGEGYVSDGADRILWNVAEQSGFRQLRAEVFPFYSSYTMHGKLLELSLPVSSKTANPGYFSGEADAITNWYQFRGDLVDSKDTQKTVTALGNHTPRWVSTGTIYGLGIGSQDTYTIPFTPFILSQNKQVTGRMAFRSRFLADGEILYAQYYTNAATLELHMGLNKGIPVLTIDDGNKAWGEVSLDKSVLDDGFVTLSLDFVLDKNQFTASIHVKEFPAQTESLTFNLDASFNGAGSFQIGGSGAELVAIVDELAVFFGTTVPIARETPEMINTEQPEEADAPIIFDKEAADDVYLAAAMDMVL